jgi:hypothetical protein
MSAVNPVLNRYDSPGLAAAVSEMALSSDADRGAIFTKPCIVELILDLVGYTHDQPLYSLSLLEPSCGNGRFFLPALDRLLKSWEAAGRPQGSLKNCLRGIELHSATLADLRETVTEKLLLAGFSKAEASRLCKSWLIQGDYLLLDQLPSFDFIAGNPPYLRQEKIKSVLLAAYRKRYKTLYDRADLYIPFIERSLQLLSPAGQLGFICTDRWTKNKYGGPLRQLISEEYHLRVYIDLVGRQAFETEVATYPAITILERAAGTVTQLVSKPEVTPSALQALSRLLSAKVPSSADRITEVRSVVNGSYPWSLNNQDHTQLVRQLESTFPTIEEAGCRVGIGVATGADRIFIADYETLDVEPSRKLPIVTTKDFQEGQLSWQGRGVLNPFDESGQLVPLERYPKFQNYVNRHRTKLKARHVARKAPHRWYKTIDRIYPDLAAKPKLLIPDIKGNASIIYENEGLYPHHNLYYITSESWDLRALQTVLLCGIAELFVKVYSTRMRGGYLRYQAQYLRRIRLPYWQDVPKRSRQRLIKAAKEQRYLDCQKLVCDLFDLNEEQRRLINQITG